MEVRRNDHWSEEASSMTQVVDRNILALLDRRQAERVSGSRAFVYIHLFLAGTWIAINLGWVPLVHPFDPSFVVLAIATSVGAIFLTTFVLITPNRMQAMADRRADLDLQLRLADRMQTEEFRNLRCLSLPKMSVRKRCSITLRKLKTS